MTMIDSLIADTLQDHKQAITKLADKVDQILAGTSATLEQARAALNECGWHAARKALADSVTAISACQDAKRAAEAELKLFGEAVNDALAEAEWEIDGRFVTESNKVWLVADDGAKKSMTADERKQYKTIEARKHPAVAAAVAAQRAAEAKAKEAADALALAERRFSACKHDLDAACAALTVMRYALTLSTNGATK